MAHSSVKYPDIPNGEGLRCLMAVLGHMKDVNSGAELDYPCVVKDIWVAITALFSKVWPKEPGQIVISSDDVAAVFGEEADDLRSTAEEIIELSSERKDQPLLVSPKAFDWMTLLMQLLPVLLEFLREVLDLWKKKE